MTYCKNYCEEEGISTSELNEAQRTLYYIAENMKINKSISEEGYRHFQMAIKALEQEPQTGHWIVAKGGSYLGMRNGCCSNCKDFYTNDWNVMKYCPNCGAKMESEEV